MKKYLTLLLVIFLTFCGIETMIDMQTTNQKMEENALLSKEFNENDFAQLLCGQ